jgi:hypothetical protein
MPTFDAGSVVEPLEYKLAPYSKASGVITEPTDQQIGDFLDGLRDLFTESQESGLSADVDTDDPAAMVEALASMNSAELVGMLRKLAELMSTLCSGKPTADELLALPLRVRVKFFGWVMSEVVNPEAEPAAGTPQPIQLRRAAGG